MNQIAFLQRAVLLTRKVRHRLMTLFLKVALSAGCQRFFFLTRKRFSSVFRLSSRSSLDLVAKFLKSLNRPKKKRKMVTATGYAIQNGILLNRGKVSMDWL